MKIFLLTIICLLIGTNANANYSSGMGTGLAVGIASGVAISSSQQNSSTIKELHNCEKGIKAQAFPDSYKNMSYEDKLYTCLQLEDIWSNLTLSNQISRFIIISIFIGFIGFMAYIIRDVFFN